MPKLQLHPENIEDPQVLIDLCPFGAMQMGENGLEINAACKMCRLCVRKGPKGAVEYIEDEKKPEIDKSEWKGIAVYVDHVDGKIHPVTFELLGKAREMADKIHQPVQAVFIGSHIPRGEGAASLRCGSGVRIRQAGTGPLCDRTVYERVRGSYPEKQAFFDPGWCDDRRMPAGAACRCPCAYGTDGRLHDPGNG